MKFNVFDKIEIISTGQMGKIVMLVGGSPDGPREAWIDCYPGAAGGYEYIRMWDETEGSVELRALNKYPIEDIKLYSKGETIKL